MVLLGYALQTQLNTSMLSMSFAHALQLQNNPIKPSILKHTTAVRGFAVKLKISGISLSSQKAALLVF